MGKGIGYDYGIIGNCRVTALISKHGSIDWFCVPRFDGQSVFAKILDENKGGFFSLQPSDLSKYDVKQTYLKNTNILSTYFKSDEDEFEILDYMPCYQDGEQLCNPIQIQRIVRVHSGYPLVKVIFSPALNFGRSKTQLRHLSNCIKAFDKDSGEELFLYTNVPRDYILNAREFRLSHNSIFVLSYDSFDKFEPLEVEKDFRLTRRYWQNWVQSCNLPEKYQQEVIRSALTLKLMFYDETGAVIAAPTTSLPEIVGKDRNWDYRYCWLRDAFFVVNALTKLSKIQEAERFIDYIKNTLVGELEYVRPIYNIDGGLVPMEEIVELDGFMNSTPVRIGNNATNHYQDDVYGEVVLSMFPLFFDERYLRNDTESLWKLVKGVVETAIVRFNEKDQGIWEFRGESKHYTFSKLMIWAALDRGYKIAIKLKKRDEAKRWKTLKDSFKDTILKQAWSEDLQAFTQSYEKKFLDASNLLFPVIGLVDGKDNRMKNTINAVQKQLMENNFVFRYKNEDDFGSPESAFLICSFWLVDALVLAGRKDEARKYFETLLQYSNHLGLFAEDINPTTKQLLGNFPQAYSHVAVINSAVLLSG
jgi:GH15 family glucan-1,4-alpha-glucosidase